MFTLDLILSVLDSAICVIDIEYVVVVTDERICAGRMMMTLPPTPHHCYHACSVCSKCRCIVYI